MTPLEHDEPLVTPSDASLYTLAVLTTILAAFAFGLICAFA
jgi:hypothetical protein